jgi:hypothetical protein
VLLAFLGTDFDQLHFIHKVQKVVHLHRRRFRREVAREELVMANPSNNPTYNRNSDTGASGRSEHRDGGSTKKREQEGKNTSIREKSREAVQKADAAASTQIDRAAEQVSEASDALSESARSFEGQSEWAAQSLKFASDQLSGLANSIEGKSLSDLLTQSKNLAGENPALFYGACAALGFVAARFASATEDRAEQPSRGGSNGI